MYLLLFQVFASMSSILSLLLLSLQLLSLFFQINIDAISLSQYKSRKKKKVENNELKEEKTCVEENSRAGILGRMKSICDHSYQLLTTHIKKTSWNKTSKNNCHVLKKKISKEISCSNSRNKKKKTMQDVREKKEETKQQKQHILLQSYKKKKHCWG